ncbi:MAG: TonB-dependent receptor [Pseudomonadota bacterium]
MSIEILDKTILKANGGYSENTPSFGQLYQPSHGSIDQVRGNPDLKKEEIISLNLGISHTFENKHEIEISLFKTDTRNLIKYQRGLDLISRPENISKAVKQGVEAIVKIHMTKDTDLDLNYIFQDTENKDNNKQLSYAPEHTFKLVLKTRFKWGTKLEITTRAYTEQYTDTQNTLSEMLDNYITTDLKLVHPVKLLGKDTSFFVHINNLIIIEPFLCSSISLCCKRRLIFKQRRRLNEILY